MLQGLLGGAGGPSGECGARLTRLAAPLASAAPAQSAERPHPARLCRLWRHRRGDIHPLQTWQLRRRQRAVHPQHLQVESERRLSRAQPRPAPSAAPRAPWRRKWHARRARDGTCLVCDVLGVRVMCSC